MSKRLYIYNNSSKNTPWYKFTFHNIEKFITYEKDNYEVIDDICNCSNVDDVYIVGYKTSEIVDTIINMRKNGLKVHIIENLCCDDSLELHRSACDKLFLHGIPKNRNFKFLKNDIINLITKAISKKNGYDVVLNENTTLTRYGLDSLDMMELVDDIEETFNVEISTVSLTKPFSIKNIPILLESGFIGRKFKD